MPTDWTRITDADLNEYADAGQRGQGALGETIRRLREAIHREEVAIKRLTAWLVVFTAVLVILGFFDAWTKLHSTS